MSQSLPVWLSRINQIASQDRRVPLAITILFVFLLIQSLFSLWNQVSVTSTAATENNLVVRRVHRLPEVASYHVFGIHEKNLQSLPATQLPLTLEGVVVNVTNPQLSYAIISVPGRKAKVYRLGDNVGGATIKEIQKNHLVLDNNGVLENLILPVPQLQNNSN